MTTMIVHVSTRSGFNIDHKICVRDFDETKEKVSDMLSREFPSKKNVTIQSFSLDYLRKNQPTLAVEDLYPTA